MLGKSQGFASKPRALMCCICGREFGTLSLEIHMKQCEKKKDNKTQIPENYYELFERIKAGDKLTNEDYDMFNNKANDDYKENSLYPCQNCGRRFLPDRLEVHLRSCKGDDKKIKFNVNNSDKKTTGNRGGLGKSIDVSSLNQGNTSTKLFEERMNNQLKLEGQSSEKKLRGNSVNPNTMSKSTVLPPIKPKGPAFLVCYVCGREFGKHSIEIHLEKCMEKHVQEELNRGVPKKKIITPDPPQELIDILDKLAIIPAPEI